LSWNSTYLGQFVCLSSIVVDSFRAGPGWTCSKAVYKPVWHITLLSVQWINSWWWTDGLSETCRVSWQNKFVKLVHLVGFITTKFPIVIYDLHLVTSFPQASKVYSVSTTLYYYSILVCIIPTFQYITHYIHKYAYKSPPILNNVFSKCLNPLTINCMLHFIQTSMCQFLKSFVQFLQVQFSTIHVISRSVMWSPHWFTNEKPLGNNEVL
jgi:hypothetical protein